MTHPAEAQARHTWFQSQQIILEEPHEIINPYILVIDPLATPLLNAAATFSSKNFCPTWIRAKEVRIGPSELSALLGRMSLNSDF